MRILLLVLAALSTPQGKPCDSSKKCPAPYRCVTTGSGRATCEQLCAVDKTGKSGGCPSDQRCLKDGELNICRPITDL